MHLAVLTTCYTKWVWRISKKVKYHKKCTGLFYTVRKQMEGKTSLFWLHARKLLQLTRKTKQIQRKLNEKKVKIPFFSFSCNDFTFWKRKLITNITDAKIIAILRLIQSSSWRLLLHIAAWNTVSELYINLCNLQCIVIDGN